jgi:Endoribonuclease L-PSP
VLITRFAGSAPWETTYGYSRVVVAGDWAITAGTTATGFEGVLHPGDAYRQALTAFTIALDALTAAGAAADQVVELGCMSPTSPLKPTSGGHIMSCLARYGRWQPWWKSRGWLIHRI